MIATSADIQDLVAEGLFGDANLTRDKSAFSDAFWDLRTRLLGELAQKLVNYRITLTLTGDFSGEVETSSALRDFIRESQRSGPIRLATPPSLD